MHQCEAVRITPARSLLSTPLLGIGLGLLCKQRLCEASQRGQLAAG